MTGIGTLLAVGGAVGGGIALIVRGLKPPRPTLAEALAELHHPTAAPTSKRTAAVGTDDGRSGWLARLGRPAAGWLAHLGLPRTRVRADLALLDRPVEVHLAEQAATAVLGLALPVLIAGTLTVAGLDIGITVPLWASILVAVAGFWTPDLIARANATERRVEFTHALGAFLDLVVIGLAGGAGVDAALTHAARVGHGWAFDRIRHALRVAEITRITPWTALADLGTTLRIPAVREVAAAVGLAGTEGAKVRASLAAKASALRLRELTDAEADANAATERMSLPVILMFAGFMIFVGYPALTSVLSVTSP
jgi:Flp pilus assembly protein TadB